MIALFPISELLMLVAFAGTVLALLIRAGAPRAAEAPIDQRTATLLFGVRQGRSTTQTESGFPSSAVC
jgi:hypothetical protein